ncbi:TonB-dependent receptor domain-containing protein [Rhodonellum sp.]|uniref:TonB-dependent receptor domain-containing protein n=1 Tax=Rhodonellum sp. TaxID=2231180 RepID=UPI00272261AB|nr:TonB-dependent receptor [Rhodonellum sp.]MDO9552489.1 TonB-dependent receptor [Rhodonellum sp.]
MKKLTLLLALLFPLSLLAQTKILIQEAGTNQAIPGVLVKAPGLKPQVSDSSGEVLLEFSAPLLFVFSHVSFETQSLEIAPGTNVTIQLKSATNALSEVIVMGFESERPLLRQAGSVSRVLENELYRFNETSIVNAFNTKAGVRVEERAPASYRISIRGSSLRSPFGVRNVKVYWNEVPFTAPDGTTPLNLLDLSNIQNTEIIKGPAGSIYGAGNGGVISLTSRQEINENRIAADVGVGDFGLLRYRFGLDQKVNGGGLSVSYVKQKSDGYREHSAVDREVFQLSALLKSSDKQKLSTQILYTDLDYQIPGALNAAQLAEDPTQARPGSVGQNSSISQKSLYGTLSHSYTFGSELENVTSLYMNTTDFENPFILDYKKETAFGYGGRTKFVHNGMWGNFPVRMVAGGEYQFSKTLAQNFGNRAGKADTIRFSDDLIASQAFLFQQLEFEWSPKVLMTLGFSENFSRFEIDRTIDAGRNNPATNVRKFDPIIVPRIALSVLLNANSGVHGSISSGFSPPTIDEVRTNEGSINLDLEAERGVNYELGYRAQFGRFNLDLTTFYFKLDQTITTFTNAQGVVLFQNAGATNQKGIEASLDYALIRNQAGLVQELKIAHAFTGHYFKFAQFTKGNDDFSGNKLTGVAPNTLVNQLDLRTKPGFYLNFTHQYVDKIPLNDANTVFQDTYNLVGSRLGWRNTLGSRWDLELYSGVDNLLDESYSLGNDLNAFGGRFFQPAPGRNWYGGLKVGFRY